MTRRIGDKWPRIMIETSSYCNRKCPTCLRQTYPDRDRIATRFVQTLLPLETIYRLLEEMVELGYSEVSFASFNEPLLDRRLPQIARRAKEMGFIRVATTTNGDYLTKSVAAKLDGNLSDIAVSLYDGTRTQKRCDEIASWFSETNVVLKSGRHYRSHHSCLPKMDRTVEAAKMMPCGIVRKRLVINYLGDTSPCCEEIVSEHALGNVNEMALRDIIYSDKRLTLIENLKKPGGRLLYRYCRICPHRDDISRRAFRVPTVFADSKEENVV